MAKNKSKNEEILATGYDGVTITPNGLWAQEPQVIFQKKVEGIISEVFEEDRKKRERETQRSFVMYTGEAGMRAFNQAVESVIATQWAEAREENTPATPPGHREATTAELINYLDQISREDV